MNHGSKKTLLWRLRYENMKTVHFCGTALWFIYYLLCFLHNSLIKNKCFFNMWVSALFYCLINIIWSDDNVKKKQCIVWQCSKILLETSMKWNKQIWRKKGFGVTFCEKKQWTDDNVKKKKQCIVWQCSKNCWEVFLCSKSLWRAPDFRRKLKCIAIIWDRVMKNSRGND